MQLKAIKADGLCEEYLHTKIIGTISNALAETGQADIFLAEQLAEVVTYHLYHKQKRRTVTSSEIFSAIKVVLASTKYSEAAVALNEYHYYRKLKRSRVEVVHIEISGLSDAELLRTLSTGCNRSRWNKSIIVRDLISKYNVDYQTARAIAAAVEEKMLRMGSTLVSAGLIKQLVLSDTAAVLKAGNQLQKV